jgi:hypothetical protein
VIVESDTASISAGAFQGTAQTKKKQKRVFFTGFHKNLVIFKHHPPEQHKNKLTSFPWLSKSPARLGAKRRHRPVFVNMTKKENKQRKTIDDLVLLHRIHISLPSASKTLRCFSHLPDLGDEDHLCEVVEAEQK